MERLKRQRRPVRAALTRCIGDVDRELGQENPGHEELGVLLKRLERIVDNLDNLDDEITAAMLDADCTDEQQDEERIAVDEYRDEAERYRLKIDKVLHPSRPASPSAYTTATDHTEHKKTYKLPKTEIRKFKGEVTEWLSWWAQFQKIHEDEDLHDSDKFQYLAQAMVDGSKASEVVRVYPQTAANYPKAIKALQERFGKEKVLKRVYVRELLKLIIKNSREKLKISATFDQLEGHLKALESLGITPDQMDVILFPMVESCVPEDILVAWQRSANYGREDRSVDPPKTEFDFLMEFVKQEVENEGQRKLAQAGFGIGAKEQKKKVYVDNSEEGSPTAAGLAATTQQCVFCDMKNHISQKCYKAKKMTAEQRSEKLKEKNACFRCIKPGHMAKFCKSDVRCSKCGKKHETIMCQEKAKTENLPTDTEPQQQSFAITRHNNFSENQLVLLKTLVVRVVGPRGSKLVRMLLDEGSQVSYIGSRTVKGTGCKCLGVERVKNMLLGGYVTDLHDEQLREVEVWDLKKKVNKKWILREKPIVCTGLPRVPLGPWLEPLRKKNITFSDLETVHVDEVDIEILVGSDLRGDIMTGKRLDLGDNLYAEETVFGWTLGGPVLCVKSELANLTITLFQQQNHKIKDLWSLDVLGIQDPIQLKSKLQEEEEAEKHFLNNVRREEDGRYCVALPWISEKPNLPSNKWISEKRLHSTTRKLKDKGFVELYDGLLKGWEQAEIVETVHEDTVNQMAHYLPHHPVFRPESKTTPVRPVFDASCKSVSGPCLNDCLYTGPNLIEQIPPIIHRFRERNIGVASDIGKAFQMIQVREEDRDYQRFLWWADSHQEKMKILRHRRVVFGVTSSPFLLGAVLKLHLSKGEMEDKEIRKKLLHSMYVDNSVTSVDTIEDYEKFREVSTELLKQAKMDLRQWEVSGIGPSRTNEGCGLEAPRNVNVDFKSGVLGLVWDRMNDTLSVDVGKVFVDGPLTKRKILSVVAKVFDPIGFTSPATLQPKMLLQEQWKSSKDWDEELEESTIAGFKKWCKEIHLLGTVKIPRQMRFSPSSEQVQLHLFTDASVRAYSAAVFIRSQYGSEVRVQLVQAKARVAPLKEATIPRLELMGCLIGVRLWTSVIQSLDLKIGKFFHWTDSTVALAWIQRGDKWGTFVANRVKEIRKSTLTKNWWFIPGDHNPADLPSRGCSPRQLVESRWWECLHWIYLPEENWPSSSEEVNEEEVNRELKGQKKSVLLINRKKSWFQTKYSSFRKNVKVMGWIKRFVKNLQSPSSYRNRDRRLSPRELQQAEYEVLKCIQKESLSPNLAELNKKYPVLIKDGLFCIMTKLLNKEDTVNFRFPVILPGNHPLVKMLILEMHFTYDHPGVQFLQCRLREKYWILGGRRAVKTVLRGCTRCRRFDAKPIGVEPAALPPSRVNPGEVFQTTGVDLAGPVSLKDKSKAWIVLFTCSVYRCVHLDVVTSLSTEAFLGALERFINQYGRPRGFHSDNGTNFVGVANLLKTLDWKLIQEKFHVDCIKWTFNPPAAPWWGGWWERLVRSVKDQLRRILGRAKLTYDELRTSLSVVQATINDRPLTVMTDDTEDLIPITPAMFLHPSRFAHWAEGELLCQRELDATYKKMKDIQRQLQNRFRSEYLSQLVQRGKEKKSPVPKVGDVVLIGSENSKRFEWPLGKIVELIPGRDGHSRVAKVQTAHDYEVKKGKSGKYQVTKIKKGRILTRPLQRLYPLEVSSAEELPVPEEIKVKRIKPEEKIKESICEDKKTRFGRQVKKPSRYGQWAHLC